MHSGKRKRNILQKIFRIVTATLFLVAAAASSPGPVAAAGTGGTQYMSTAREPKQHSETAFAHHPAATNAVVPMTAPPTGLGGSGTSTDPYLITSPADLNNINNYNSVYTAVYYKLTMSVDISTYSNWTPIGNATTPFSGYFDGNHQTITGLTINTSSGDAGLFGDVAYGAQIQNVSLADCNVNETGGNDAGALVGYNEGSVSGCSVTSGSVSGSGAVGGLVGENDGWGGSASITGSSASGAVSGNWDTGGLVGWNDGDSGTASIADSSASGSVTGSGGNAYGGLVGHNDGASGTASITNSYATGAVSGGTMDSGGLVGWNDGANGTASILDAHATGSVTASGDSAWAGGLVGHNDGGGNTAAIAGSYASGAVSGDWDTGGLVGYNDGDDGTASILASSATGSVTGSGGNAYGGLVGHNDGDGNTAAIDTSYATGVVSGSNDAGGLVGWNDGDFGGASIEDSYATGSAACSGGNGFNGGLVGHNDGDIGLASITNSYATGAVAASVYNGGLAGYNDNDDGTVPITSSYWDTTTTGQTVAGDSRGTASASDSNGENDTQMKQQGTFSGWDFSNAWGINQGYSYPYLLAAPYPTPAVTSISPDTGPPAGGTSVTVNGTGLSTAKAVYFGSNQASFKVGISVSGATYVDAVSPAGSGGVDIVVRTPAGASATNSSDWFTYATSSSGGGGGSAWPQPVHSTTGSAVVPPEAGGTVALGTGVSVTIPAGALQGSADVDVTIQSEPSPPPAPQGYTLIGAYEFTADGQNHYTFNSPVTMTFTFDPSKVPPGTTPAVYYYDGTKWVLLTGTVDSANDTVTVTVNHWTEYAVMAQVPAQPTPPAVTLKDIAGNWAQADIEKLVSLGAITGYPPATSGGYPTFRPNNDITRAEFVTVLVKALKLAPKAGPVFADTQGTWAQGYISTAAAARIVGGYDTTHFGPDDPITREQMTAIVVRASKLAAVSGELSFKDASSIDPWAGVDVETAVKAGIIHGYPDGTFRPLGHATRAEAVTVIAALLK